jgi:hypothetical protein
MKTSPLTCPGPPNSDTYHGWLARLHHVRPQLSCLRLIPLCIFATTLSALSVTTINVTNYIAPGQLIDSNSNSIAVQAQYDFKASQSNAPEVTRELRFRLLDPSGTPVALNVAGTSQPFLTVNDVFNNPLIDTESTVNAMAR